MKANRKFLNRKCRLTYNTGFMLHGVVRDLNDFGVMFETTQKTSFIAWNVIRELVPEENGGF